MPLGARAQSHWSAPWVLMLLLMTAMIGLRHRVGADWVNYANINENAKAITLDFSILGQGDPSYIILNWIGANIFGGVYFVNSVCGFLFSLGILKFCRRQRRSWLTLTVAIPYLVVVVAMGYSRQAVAIGLSMLALIAILDGKLYKFMLVLTLAATFHKSAIILIPLAMFSRSVSKTSKLFFIFVFGYILFFLLLQESLEALKNEYVFGHYESTGTSIRLAMNAIPGVLFLFFRKRFVMEQKEKGLWVTFSYLSIFFPIILLISPSSTPVDRVALYLLPIQLFFYSRFPDTFSVYFGKIIHVGTIIFSGFVMYFWLTYADNAFLWVPYRFYPFEVFWNFPDPVYIF